MKAIEIKGKKMVQLIAENILPSKENQIPMPGMKIREEYEFIIRNCDAYSKYFSLMTEKQLTGTEKQVTWALKIREEKAKAAAFELVVSLHIMNIASDFLSKEGFNKKANDILKQFNSTNASYFINNRF